MIARTLYDKLWESHTVHVEEDGTTLLYVDRHLVHEVTSPQAFEGMKLARRKPWRISANLAVADHNVPTTDRSRGIADPVSRLQVDTLDANCAEYGIVEFKMNDARQGIVHVIGPEQGATLPGMTVVCGDSHTSTHGAFGCLAFGIGTSEVEHVLSTQCLLAKKMKNMLVRVEGPLARGVTAKDLALAVIGRIGIAGGTGCTIEYAGSTVRSLTIEGRMTLCNMSIEAGARAGLVAVDEVTLAYLKGRPFAPRGALWDRAVAHWRALESDREAKFDREVTIDARSIKPQVTWGTSPEMVVTVDERVPDPDREKDAIRREGMERALTYMGLEPNTPMTDIRIDKVFIGSCTNSRIEDLRAAAAVVRGRRLASNIKLAMVVPGSGLVSVLLDDKELVPQLAGFETAFGVAVNATTNQVYVSSLAGLVVIDGSRTPDVILPPPIPVGAGARGVAVDEGTNFIYVAASDPLKGGPALVPVDGSKNVAVLTDVVALPAAGSGVAFNPNDGFVYVAIPTLQEVVVIDPKPGAARVVTEVRNLGKGTYGVAVDVKGNVVYVTNRDDNNVSVINPVDFKEVDRLQVGRNPEGLGVDSDRGVVYVGNYGDGSLSLIDAVKLNVFATLVVGQTPKAAVVDPSTGRVYVPSQLDNVVRVIQP